MQRILNSDWISTTKLITFLTMVTTIMITTTTTMRKMMKSKKVMVRHMNIHTNIRCRHIYRHVIDTQTEIHQVTCFVSVSFWSTGCGPSSTISIVRTYNAIWFALVRLFLSYVFLSVSETVGVRKFLSVGVSPLWWTRQERFHIINCHWTVKAKRVFNFKTVVPFILLRRRSTNIVIHIPGDRGMPRRGVFYHLRGSAWCGVSVSSIIACRRYTSSTLRSPETRNMVTTISSVWESIG